MSTGSTGSPGIRVPLDFYQLATLLVIVLLATMVYGTVNNKGILKPLTPAPAPVAPGGCDGTRCGQIAGLPVDFLCPTCRTRIQFRLGDRNASPFGAIGETVKELPKVTK